MGKIDETRWILPLFLILCISASVLPILLSWDLIYVRSYEAFAGLLDKFYIDHMLLTRVIINNLNYLSFNIMKVIKSIIGCLSIFNLILLFLALYLWCAKKENFMKAYRRIITTIIFLYTIIHLLCVLILISGFALISLDHIIFLFHLCGYVLLLGYIGIVVNAFYGFMYYVFHLDKVKRLLN